MLALFFGSAPLSLTCDTGVVRMSTETQFVTSFISIFFHTFIVVNVSYPLRMSFCIDKTVVTLINMVWTLLNTFCNDVGSGAQQVCARYDLRGSLSAKLNDAK